MSHKSARILETIKQYNGQLLDARYLGFIAYFNQQQFYEAHEVLEDLWLDRRHTLDGLFYKALIQLAGAFVHVQKNRPQPAAALLKSAREYLQAYPAIHHYLELRPVLTMIEHWLQALEISGSSGNPLAAAAALKLQLVSGVGSL
jgi:predicted metal-dependent hydrolase